LKHGKQRKFFPVLTVSTDNLRVIQRRLRIHRSSRNVRCFTANPVSSTEHFNVLGMTSPWDSEGRRDSTSQGAPTDRDMSGWQGWREMEKLRKM